MPRLITVAADQRNFTLVAESDGAVVLLEQMNDLFSQCEDVVTSSGGSIWRAVGGALVAYWTWSEENAERAAEAALVLAELSTSGGLEIAVAIDEGECPCDTARVPEYHIPTCPLRTVDELGKMWMTSGGRELLVSQAMRPHLGSPNGEELAGGVLRLQLSM